MLSHKLLNQDKETLLNLTRLPARLDDEQTATLLGFQKHDIPVLVRARILKPLGKPANNATKYFATCEILPIAEGAELLAKATNVLYRHWQKKNKKQNPEAFRAPGNVSALN